MAFLVTSIGFKYTKEKHTYRHKWMLPYSPTVSSDHTSAVPVVRSMDVNKVSSKHRLACFYFLVLALCGCSENKSATLSYTVTTFKIMEHKSDNLLSLFISLPIEILLLLLLLKETKVSFNM